MTVWRDLIQFWVDRDSKFLQRCVALEDGNFMIISECCILVFRFVVAILCPVADILRFMQAKGN